MNNIYSTELNMGQMHGSSLAARKILPIVFEQLSTIPKSVVDVGCGMRTCLEAVEQLGINNYLNYFNYENGICYHI